MDQIGIGCRNKREKQKKIKKKHFHKHQTFFITIYTLFFKQRFFQLSLSVA